MTKYSKSDVNYSRGHKDSHCGYTFTGDTGHCRHYIEGSGSAGACELVTGVINPVYWCELWEQEKSKR